MPLRFQKWITRNDLMAHRDWLFAFGDNMEGTGLKGQAKEMRFAVNAVGIPTKWRPSNKPSAFFSDSDLPAVKGLIERRFNRLCQHLQRDGIVVLPEAGLGTGQSRLATKAPKILALIDAQIQRLREIDSDTKLACVARAILPSSSACDILGEKPPLELTEYNFIQVSGDKFALHLEIRDDALVIRRIDYGGTSPLLIRPTSANAIEIPLRRMEVVHRTQQ